MRVACLVLLLAVTALAAKAPAAKPQLAKKIGAHQAAVYSKILAEKNQQKRKVHLASFRKALPTKKAVALRTYERRTAKRAQNNRQLVKAIGKKNAKAFYNIRAQRKSKVTKRKQLAAVMKKFSPGQKKAYRAYVKAHKHRRATKKVHHKN